MIIEQFFRNGPPKTFRFGYPALGETPASAKNTFNSLETGVADTARIPLSSRRDQAPRICISQCGGERGLFTEAQQLEWARGS